jgi:hypothetical protein
MKRLQQAKVIRSPHARRKAASASAHYQKNAKFLTDSSALECQTIACHERGCLSQRVHTKDASFLKLCIPRLKVEGA